MDRKLSEIILEMIEPYNNEDIDLTNRLIRIALISWNSSLLSNKEYEEYYETILDEVENFEDKKNWLKLHKRFRKEKKNLYSNDNRFIESYDLFNEGKDHCRLVIASRPVDLGKTEKKEIARSNKIGRNEPCHCGSGKKYKKCCGR